MTDPIEAAIRECRERLTVISVGCDCYQDVNATLRSLVSTVRAFEREATLEEAAEEFEGERADWDLNVPVRIRALKSKEPTKP